eukprot:GSChrysophyteH1.ASY1.ANO1.586.1 assembled CDS
MMRSNRITRLRSGLQRFSTKSATDVTKAAAPTHEVYNQSRPFVDVDLWQSDPTLQRAIRSLTSEAFAQDDDALMTLERHGRASGYLGVMAAADQAEANKPVLDNFDQYGRRVDTIRYHPSYHKLMQHGVRGGATSYGYNQESAVKQLNGHITRAGLMYMQNQIEPGHCCPLVMTSACIPVLQAAARSASNDRLAANDSSNPQINKPIELKDGITIGMSMTEKQGGSDVRANTTTAVPEMDSVTGEGEAYRLWGHKWFTSAPMSDGFLTLAKNKLADRSNASSEVEYHGAYGQMIGQEGKGLQTILQMVQMTRSAFGLPLLQQPLMENLLTDLCLTSEATTLSAMRMASAHARFTLKHEADVFRVGVAILKYHCTKAAPLFAYECMEIFGGNGFTEDFPMAKLFRHSPLNSIWEGSGNVMTLDVLRASNAIPAFLKDMQTGARGKDKHLDAYFDDLNKIMRMARYIVDRLAIGYQASLLLKHGHEDGRAASAFIASRIRPAVCDRNSGANLELGIPFGLNYGASTAFEPATARSIIEDHMPRYSAEQPEKADWPLFL